VKSSGGPDIDKRRIEVKNPIKTLGAHQVTVKVHDDVSATVNLEVVAS
jgi:large subunit ribosomal protein L9